MAGRFHVLTAPYYVHPSSFRVSGYSDLQVSDIVLVPSDENKPLYINHLDCFTSHNVDYVKCNEEIIKITILHLFL